MADVFAAALHGMSEAAPETAASAPGKWRRAPGLNWRQVGILYGREMRGALREKTIVINSILIPIFLYPFLLWAGISGLMFVMGQTAGFVSRVEVAEWPKGHSDLRRSLQQDESLHFEKLKSTADAERKIRDGQLDALLEFLPVTNNPPKLEDNFRVRITYNESQERSATALGRLKDAITHYRHQWLQREAESRGIDTAEWTRFVLTRKNVASRKEMGAFILGLMLPLLFVVMVAVGCFYPAVDTTAGERERHTWETLMTTAADRLSIVTAKYLYVASMGGLAGILNLVTMTLALKPIFAPLLGNAGENIEFTVRLSALPVLAVAAVLLAGFIAAGMMIFAAFARTFKEGQAMISPFYMIVLLPVIFLQAPGLKFSVALACVPVANVAMMLRAAISGTLAWLPAVVTLAASITLIVLALALASFILQFEDVLLGSYSGSFNKFLRVRVFRRNKSRPALAGERG